MIPDARAPAENIVDAKKFWHAVGQRATGSTVITARSPDGPAGFLGLSATHVCADPPVMLVSIDKRTSALATIFAARHFAINYLPREARAVAEAFSGRTPQKGADRFQEALWQAHVTGAPIFINAVGAIECVLEETIERHSVVIALGRVVNICLGNSNTPLVHFRGDYLS